MYKCFLFITLIFIISTGCSHNVGLKKVGSSGRIKYEDTFVFNGGLSAETVNILGNNLLKVKMRIDPGQFITDLETLYRRDPSPQILIAVAETSQYIASEMRDDPDIAVRYDLTTLIYTQKYFQESINTQKSKLFDPEAIIAAKCYNLALTELFAYLKERELHTAGTFELTAAGGQILLFDKPEFKLPVTAENIKSFSLCADFRPQNLTHDSRKFGLGVPLVCELTNNAIPETVFAEKQVIPATLIIQMLNINATNKLDRHHVNLMFLDSRSIDFIKHNGTDIPLAQDFSTPLAYMVKDSPVFGFIKKTFQVESASEEMGLYHLEPHHDDRIPIVLVHGLMSDIRTWLQLINTLQSDPFLRKHYRFMGFSYSSGNPIFITAMDLRNALKKERDKLIRDGRNIEKFDKMILIGHSMGGLLSRMLISTSNDQILENIVGKKIYNNIDDRNDKEFRDIMIFEPFPSVKRVIFIAVPHRGSKLAQSWIGKMASSMIKIPQSLINFNRKLVKKLVHLNDDEKKRMLDSFNGIDNLSPDGLALQLLNKMPICDKIPFHSIIGNKGKSGAPGGSDGVVSYSSSHLDGAKSETIVKSDHSVQQDPLAIQEIKRILKLHLNYGN